MSLEPGSSIKAYADLKNVKMGMVTWIYDLLKFWSDLKGA
jgi:hypothetical protein